MAIARALMQQPKMVLADEPIASLDPLSAERVMNALREIRDRDHLTVICNLHTLDTARTYCDRVIGMLDGAYLKARSALIDPARTMGKAKPGGGARNLRGG